MMIHEQGYPGMNSIEYLLRHYFFPEMKGYVTYIIIVSAAILLAWSILMNLKRERNHPDHAEISSLHLGFEWFLILALIPDLVKTDSEHFLATGPLITFIIYFIALRKKRILIPLMVFLVFFYGANSTDLLGRELSDRLFSMGLLGLSNLLIVLLSVILFFQIKHNEAH